jgi:hypothetical protein
VFRKDIVFIVDISGSMRGKLLDDTKNALFLALSKLDPKDSFSIIAFNGETYLFSTSLELATKEAVERAIQWVSMNFIAGGDTNILLPLNKVCFRIWFSKYFIWPLPIFCTSSLDIIFLTSMQLGMYQNISCSSLLGNGDAIQCSGFSSHHLSSY